MNRVKKISRDVRRGISWLAEQNQLKALPIKEASQGYNPAKARNDLRAGLNVALLAFPQGMAYASIAGLPIQYGIYGSAIAAIVGPIFGGSRFIMLGPTNATSVLLFTSFLALSVTEAEKLAMLPILLSLVGIFLVVGAFFRVANLIQYVSRTVITGYITAAAFYIIVNQMRKVLGIDFEIPEGTTFFGIIKLTVLHLPVSHLPSMILSVITAGAFIFMSRKFRHLPNVAICLVFGSVAALGVDLIFAEAEGWYGGAVNTLKPINASHWKLTLPPFHIHWVSQLAGTALIVSFLCILEGASIGKSLAARAGERLDTNQEMLGMGMANLACAFYMGMPASGSLSRSQLNFNSGAATPWASVICGVLCAIGAFGLGSLTGYIPQAVLGVLVITIGVSLISRFHIRVVTKTTKSDATVFITTFLAALFVRLEFGIILGAMTSILLFLKKAAVPELVEYTSDDKGRLKPLEDPTQRSNPQVSIVHVEGELFFGAAELFRDQMRRVVEDPNLKIVVLKMRNAHHLDATSVLALMELVRYMHEYDRHLLVSEARKDVIRVFRNSGLIDVVGRENIFADAAQNPTLSTAKALKRAKEILGGQEADVSIYVDPSKSSH